MLRGRVAVVTDSSSGIGLGIACKLAAGGADIVMNGSGEASTIDAGNTRSSYVESRRNRLSSDNALEN